MPFKSPIIETPSDGERIQFKIVGDPEIVQIKSISIGRFEAHDQNIDPKGLIGYIYDEESGNRAEIWSDERFNEVAEWRPVQELLHIE